MKLLKNNLPHVNNLLNTTIQSHPIKMGCCNAKEKCWSLQQSIPFGIAILYIMVQNLSFYSKFVALKARRASSLHTIILTNKTQTKQHFV